MNKGRIQLRWFEAGVVVAVVAACAVVGPLRGVFAAAPALLSAALADCGLTAVDVSTLAGGYRGLVPDTGSTDHTLVRQELFLRRRARAGGFRD